MAADHQDHDPQPGAGPDHDDDAKLGADLCFGFRSVLSGAAELRRTVFRDADY